MLVETIVAAIVPAFIEGTKQLIVRFTGGVKPTSVNEQIQLQEAEMRRLQALAALDNPHGKPSQWVVDLRASSRYLGCLTVIGAGLIALFVPDIDSYVRALAMEAASVCFGFLFGQRILVNFKPSK